MMDAWMDRQTDMKVEIVMQIPDLGVVRGAFAFHQGNCCFHILDSVAVDADFDNDAFAARRSAFVQLLELTNAVGYTKPNPSRTEAAVPFLLVATCLNLS